MLKNKISKVKRMRGTSSHGWGHKKKHRGAGHRGGKGLSGTGARGDAQKPSILTNSKSILNKIAAVKGVKLSKIKFGTNYFGKYGFTSIHSKKQNVLSISYIENNFESLIENEIIVKKEDKYLFDTVKLNYDKVLGKGNFSKKVDVIVRDISKSAKDRIESIGGTVKIISSKKSKVESN